MEYNFNTGGVWDDPQWAIKINHTEKAHLFTGCRHCHSIENVTEFEKKWVVPRVVIAANDGGYNSTGVCLDCILEAAEYLKKLT
jgi:hypothetical protein